MQKTLLALALSAIASVPLSAQAPVLGNLTFGGDASSNGQFGNAAVGPYKGSLVGFGPLFGDDLNAVLWCVDFDHFAPAKGATDDYWATPVASPFTSTYTVQNNLALYQQAAWLIEQYDATDTKYSARNVQGSIWKLFSPTTFTATDYYDLSGYLPQAISAADLTRDWFVLSDKPDASNGVKLKDNQEFLYSIERTPDFSVVPEPASLALVMLGLAGLGVSARRRRTSVRE